MRGLVTTLAHELAPEVRVNGVAPGGTLGTDLRGLATPRARRAAGSRRPGPGGANSPPATRCGVALAGDDHAWSYVFLASERARGITGDVVHSDGGMGARG